MEPAKPTGNAVDESLLNLTGKLMPVNPGYQPAFVTLECDPDALFLPIFSTKEKLDEGMQGISYQKIVKIDDHREFLDSIPQRMPDGTRIRIAVNLRRVDGVKSRWVEIFRD